MITVSDGLTVLSFKGLLWTDRSRDKVAGSERTTFGRLVVQRLAVSAGKSITIESKFEGDRLRGWFTYSQVRQLMVWRDEGTQLVLTFDTEVRSGVIPLGGISIEPVRQYDKTPGAEEVCSGTLTILEV